MSGGLRDLRQALRGLLRSPGFALSVVLSLAIGIGANAAVFSVASALLLRPLPYADAERLVILWNRSPGLGIAEDWFSTAQYFDIRSGHQGFDELAIAIGANHNLTGDGPPERVGTIRASANLLTMLGARAAHGRLFGAADEVPGGAAGAVLGHATWLRRDHPAFYPPSGGLTFDAVPLHEQVVGNVRQALRVLVAAVAFVLLIAGVNVANLLLARASARRKEVALRGALGLLFCLAGVRALATLGSASVPRLHEIEVGPLVLLFTLAVSLLSGLLFGLVPALRLSRPDMQATLTEGRHGSSAGGGLFSRRDSLRRVLVGGEIALSVVLLVAAALLVRSFARVQQVPPGFDPRGVLTFELVSRTASTPTRASRSTIRTRSARRAR